MRIHKMCSFFSPFTYSINHQKEKTIITWCSNFYIKTSHKTELPSALNILCQSITRTIKEIVDNSALGKGQFISNMKKKKDIKILGNWTISYTLEI